MTGGGKSGRRDQRGDLVGFAPREMGSVEEFKQRNMTLSLIFILIEEI